jgi:HlyD family secretion protein
MKKLFALIVVLGLGWGGYSMWKHWDQLKAKDEAPSRVSSAVAELRDISFAVNAAGEISPAEQVSVRPEINGRIEELPVDLGDHVKKDDLLFKLDDKELQQQKASSVTDIERSKLSLTKAERDFTRAKQLLADNLIAQELYDDTKTAYELAKNSLERSQRDLAIIDERLTKTEVRAPFDCTVLLRPVSIGQAVSGSGGFNSGTEVLTIADLNSMIINAHVNQADVPRLKPDQTVEITIEAVPGLKVTGNVERIAPQASIKNNIKGFAARIILRNVDPRVRPGMTANIKIPVASADNVTAVPLSAVFTERNQDTGQMERYVFVQQGTAYERKSVKVGVSDFFYAEIQEGLEPGAIVALEMPKEERDKKKSQTAGLRPGGGSGLAATRTGTNVATTATPPAATGSGTDAGAAKRPRTPGDRPAAPRTGSGPS